MSLRSRFLLAVSGALLFGFLAGLLHGNDGGLRAEFGNLSAPWLFVALIPAWWAGSAVRGAVLGTSATFVALTGFYIGLTSTMYGHIGPTHGAVQSLEFILGANRICFAAGLISGPVCGIVSGFLGPRLGTTGLTVAPGVLLVGEIGVDRGLQGVEMPILHLQWGVSGWGAYEVEATLGLLIVASLVAKKLRPAP